MNTYSRKTYLIGAALAIIVIAGGFYAYKTLSTPMQSYTNAEYGISFNYPATYALNEYSYADRKTIVLADKEALAQAPQNGEGPTSITFDIIKNPTGLSSSEWVRQNSASNFQLATGGLASTTQAGIEAVAYMWDGLYRGESYVFGNDADIVMASVTMLETTDQIRKDFERILRTLVLN